MKLLSKLTLTILIAALTIFYSCSSYKKTATEKSVNCQPMQLVDSVPAKGDFYTLDTLSIVNDCLNVSVTYDGGCGTADANLYYTDRIMESFPPKTVLFFIFTDNDACRSIIKKTFSFDLSPFSEKASTGGIWLKIAGTDKRVFYKR